MTLIWEDPPRPPQPKWSEQAAELRAHPGKSARLATNTNYDLLSALKSRIKRGKIKGMEPGEFDAVVDRLTPGGDEWGLWAWYIGGSET